MKKEVPIKWKRLALTGLSVLGTALLVPAEGVMMAVQLWVVLPLILILILLALTLSLVSCLRIGKKR